MGIINKLFFKTATLLISISFFSTISFAQTQNSPQPSAANPKKAEQKNLRGDTPQFGDFPAGKIFNGTPASVDLSSHPDAQKYQTRLCNDTSEGPNFAGHYTVVWLGCGNECQYFLIVDVRNGKVYGGIRTSRGADFRIDSILLIGDPPCPRDYNPCVSWGRIKQPIRYYVMEKNGLKFIHKEQCRFINGEQECDD